jgi:hypothetical protein
MPANATARQHASTSNEKEEDIVGRTQVEPVVMSLVEENESEIVPDELKHLRACMVCSLVKTLAQFVGKLRKERQVSFCVCLIWLRLSPQQKMDVKIVDNSIWKMMPSKQQKKIKRKKQKL